MTQIKRVKEVHHLQDSNIHKIIKTLFTLHDFFAVYAKNLSMKLCY